MNGSTLAAGWIVFSTFTDGKLSTLSVTPIPIIDCSQKSISSVNVHAHSHSCLCFRLTRCRARPHSQTSADTIGGDTYHYRRSTFV
ncbi:hypothetical protein BDB00DRAFT_813979 [Zychaea mexicana]|uniref:uncharacterized protein n=1 Tax=Zychaea mexicana TaxID=64656 RepID=UPI0022FDC66C|nr:uncharacterized protein BDB00DRAFT_813979 [Zychaea mexicana]KAI9495286.1 hypothetical protein BDB00DRAFT_813979 [Zychaea mexicana]